MGDTHDHTGSKRRHDDIEDSRKKAKMGGAQIGGEGAGAVEKPNPYLAHMRDGEADGTAFEGLSRRNTTAKQAEQIEDRDTNPFTERPHSTKYFNILQSRRDLPVCKQR